MNPKVPLLVVLAALAFSGVSSALTSVTDCMELDTAGETYQLANDIAGSEIDNACIYVSADNITLDCGRYSIASEDSAIDRYGIYIRGNHTVISNCAVDGFSYDSGNGFDVYVNSSHDVTIEDGSFTGSDFGLWAVSSDRLGLIGNSAGKNTFYGFSVLSSDYTEIRENDADLNELGFYLESCDHASLRDNSASENSNVGFRIYSNSYDILERNNATSNTAHGFLVYANEGKSYNNLTGNLANLNGGDGFHFTNEDNNRFVNNNASDNILNGFFVELDSVEAGVNSDNNVFINNSATGNGFGTRCMPGTFPCPINGFLIEGSDHTYFTNNTAYNNAGSGFFVYHGEHNVLEDNIAESNLQHGFYVTAHQDIRRSKNNLTRNAARMNGVDGFFIQDDQNRLLYNNATDNGANGFELAQPFCLDWTCSGNGNVLIGNRAESNGRDVDAYCQEPGYICGNGFLIVGVNGTTLSDNIASNNADSGFRVFNGAYTLLEGNNASKNWNGFELDNTFPTSYNNITNCLSDSNGNDGFRVLDDRNRLVSNRGTSNGGNGFSVIAPVGGCDDCTADYNVLIGNVADGNSGEGFYVNEFTGGSASARHNLLEGNIAYENGDGITGTSGFFITAPETDLRDNTAYDNYEYGFFVDSNLASHTTDVNLSGNTAYGHRLCGRACTGAGFQFRGTIVVASREFSARMASNDAYDNDYGVNAANGILDIARTIYTTTDWISTALRRWIGRR
jgi:parallel beta-helix repeat protein